MVEMNTIENMYYWNAYSQRFTPNRLLGMKSAENKYWFKR
jgi:hypothetical protein